MYSLKWHIYQLCSQGRYCRGVFIEGRSFIRSYCYITTLCLFDFCFKIQKMLAECTQKLKTKIPRKTQTICSLDPLSWPTLSWQSIKLTHINPFSTNVPLLYPLNTSENRRISDVFGGYRSGTLVQNGLKFRVNEMALSWPKKTTSRKCYTVSEKQFLDIKTVISLFSQSIFIMNSAFRKTHLV